MGENITKYTVQNRMVEQKKNYKMNHDKLCLRIKKKGKIFWKIVYSEGKFTLGITSHYSNFD